ANDGVSAAEPVFTAPSEPLPPPPKPTAPPAPAPAPEAPEPPPPPRPSAPPPQKKVKLADDVVMGIDLGTTTCRAAVFLDGAPRLVPLGAAGNAQFVLPTVVALNGGGEPVVGHSARGILVSAPQNAAAGFKRVMGRRARSRQI